MGVFAGGSPIGENPTRLSGARFAGRASLEVMQRDTDVGQPRANLPELHAVVGARRFRAVSVPDLGHAGREADLRLTSIAWATAPSSRT